MEFRGMKLNFPLVPLVNIMLTFSFFNAAMTSSCDGLDVESLGFGSLPV